MALNDVALCSRALIRIGASPIVSFNDGTAESEIAGALYAPICDALLSSYRWSFATGQIALTALSESPIADYSYAFQLPVDFLKAISCGVGTKGRGVNYRIAQGQIHCNVDALTLTYTYRPDEESFPPFFDAALIARLSAEFCIPITESTSRAQALFKISEDEFAKARQIDAQQQSPTALQNFSLIDIRD
jgi:hypothetical protein